MCSGGLVSGGCPFSAPGKTPGEALLLLPLPRVTACDANQVRNTHSRGSPGRNRRLVQDNSPGTLRSSSIPGFVVFLSLRCLSLSPLMSYSLSLSHGSLSLWPRFAFAFQLRQSSFSIHTFLEFAIVTHHVWKLDCLGRDGATFVDPVCRSEIKFEIINTKVGEEGRVEIFM